MNRKIAVVGLGYVGLPVAVAFGKKYKVIGFDINETRIMELQANFDRTNEVNTEDLKSSDIMFTNDKNELKNADFIIVAVPTPINEHNQPDLTPLLGATETVGSIIKKDDIIVFESTVYPGATMQDCLPIIESESGLKGGADFFLGYSPERINPGDKVNTFETITKVVSGQTPEVLEIVADVYASVVNAGVHKAPTIEVAEAAKVIENTQRDLNIALMNELALIFDKADINTKDVLEAASTKWNFLNFKPGLVGGHCIGVDPYYLTHKAQELGYHPEVILSGRKINDGMSKFIATSVIKGMLKNKIQVMDAQINLYGLTFKEDCPDLRNTKVIDVIKELEDYGLNINVNDVRADYNEAKDIYGIDLIDIDDLPLSKVAILAVSHSEYVDNKEKILSKLEDKSIIFDIKGVLNDQDLTEGMQIWRL